MIRHVVLCRFREDADVAAVFAALSALKEKIPGILAISCGADNSPEGLQKGFTHGSPWTSPMPRRAMRICLTLPIRRQERWWLTRSTAGSMVWL